MLGLNPHNLTAPSPLSPFPTPRVVLYTSHLSCIFCPVADLNIVPTLRRREKGQVVWVLDDKFHWVQADLLIAHCASCRADYYPDQITFKDKHNSRRQKLEISPEYIRISKHGIWAHRHIAVVQENALNRFHSGWSNFADWLNDSTRSERTLTYRQSQRLFMEHSSRRLLLFHRKDAEFTCKAHPSTRFLAAAVRSAIGVNGGVLEVAMSHGCVDCTHIKRYRSDLIEEGAILEGALDVAGMPAEENVANPAIIPDDPGVAQVTMPPQQEAPIAGEPRGYSRLAVMDGRTIKHNKCALDACEGPLLNYKNGRFCEDHINLRDVCGIIPCGRPARDGELTCDTQSHMDWHRQYTNRFSRLSFPGVRRVIRRQQELADDPTVMGPSLRVELAALSDTPGDQVVHTFKAKSTYCLQTVQWACGFPIGWGKCYRSESSSQVLAILDKIWEGHPEARPSFIAYDDACSLLRHIVTQDANSQWILTTKFIVDAWHYIGHRATDILCRLWCNPAPTNGSQPDLVLLEEDANERVEKRVDSKDLGLSEAFWTEATGN
ncbi:hypothetical protein B0H17DRAFT_1223993 [Mycena rosella]|uniref:CxC6 like cysteine cluster associated with KDZ domain-containing protein n=1 Tax=Mycena rosella TaxID=1033263 RepID=A0AAD7H3B6_MYCRO|nr:hypothetical protein B0H17DRAFT_1223993 [Mycena rosella]